MAKKKVPIAKSRLEKLLKEHRSKVFLCATDGEVMVFRNYVEGKDNNIVTTWQCPNGHLRHFKLVI